METSIVGSDFGEARAFRIVLGPASSPVVGFQLGWRDEFDFSVGRRWLYGSTYSATAILTEVPCCHRPAVRLTGFRIHSALNKDFRASAMALS